MSNIKIMSNIVLCLIFLWAGGRGRDGETNKRHRYRTEKGVWERRGAETI